jgi:hypothetical protein
MVRYLLKNYPIKSTDGTSGCYLSSVIPYQMLNSLILSPLRWLLCRWPVVQHIEQIRLNPVVGLKTSISGYLVVQDTYFVTTIKVVNSIYQQTVSDTHK